MKMFFFIIHIVLVTIIAIHFSFFRKLIYLFKVYLVWYFLVFIHIVAYYSHYFIMLKQYNINLFVLYKLL